MPDGKSRRPAAGIELDDRGQPSWDPRTTRLADKPVVMAGDVSGHIPLLHEASDEGRIAGANSMLYPRVAAHVRRNNAEFGGRKDYQP
jgi:dihydrolipoamide dehydrogenase